MNSFTISGPQDNYISISVNGFERNPNGDYHDDNWLAVTVSVKSGVFTGEFEASFVTYEIKNFSIQLKELYSSLNGKAVFTTLEKQLYLSLNGNGTGQIEISGVATDKLGGFNKFEFTFESDQTYLATSIRQLSNVTSNFPIRSA